MMRLGLNTSKSLEYRMHSPLVHWGQSFQGPDEDPGELTSGRFEFLGRSNAPHVGVTRDSGNGESVHGHPNDGDQRCF